MFLEMVYLKRGKDKTQRWMAPTITGQILGLLTMSDASCLITRFSRCNTERV